MPIRRPTMLAGMATAAVSLVACDGEASVLDPAGPRAAVIAELTWLMTAIAAAVFVVVLALLGLAIWRGRRDSQPSRLGRRGLVIAGGIVLPVLVLPIIYVLSLMTMSTLAEPGEETALEMEVVAFRWGYQTTYPNGRVLEDEIRMPVGERVLLRLRSEDVIHSFWVPRLAGKQDFIPGRDNEIWIEANEPGTYEGLCAEFCGIGHAQMEFVVIAMQPAEFEAWLAGTAP